MPRIGVKQPLVQIFSNDPRLADLAAWDPSLPADTSDAPPLTHIVE
jgi:hypothetical protein